MKRTLSVCLLVGLAVPIWAQSSQPSNVKVVAVPNAQTKPSAAKPAQKPAVIAVKPAAKPAVAVVPAKPAAQSAKPAQAKPAVAVVPAKPTPDANAHAKPAVAVVPAKGATPAPHVAVAAKPEQHPSKVMAAPKPVIVSGSKDPFSKAKKPQVSATPVVAKAPEKKGAVVAVKDANPPTEKKPEPKKISAVGRRDPFVSPVVHLGAIGSGCSSGKRCLAIDQIALKGVVRSENGMIAVVVNAMDKAYFLRENDPVFNGYVTKITADSIVFKETFRDKLGKELTRDVTKTISRPAA
jgi:Tfp pilus assembly protein PilP